MNEPTDSQQQNERVSQYILDLLRLVAREVVRRVAGGSDSSKSETTDDLQAHRRR